MIVSDEYLDEILDRYDQAREKNWNDWFNLHFKKGNNMNEHVKNMEDLPKTDVSLPDDVIFVQDETDFPVDPLDEVKLPF